MLLICYYVTELSLCYSEVIMSQYGHYESWIIINGHYELCY